MLWKKHRNAKVLFLVISTWPNSIVFILYEHIGSHDHLYFRCMKVFLYMLESITGVGQVCETASMLDRSTRVRHACEKASMLDGSTRVRHVCEKSSMLDGSTRVRHGCERASMLDGSTRERHGCERASMLDGSTRVQHVCERASMLNGSTRVPHVCENASMLDGSTRVRYVWARVRHVRHGPETSMLVAYTCVLYFSTVLLLCIVFLSISHIKIIFVYF